MAHGSIVPSPSILLATFVLIAPPAGASAQSAGDPDAGLQIAKTWCINCHVVTRDQAQGTSNGAPPFTAIAQTTAITPEALRTFLQTPHHRMPDLHLTRNEIDNVSAYIFSLRTATKP
jgi:mono/diheme cytochrome c family protein